MRFTEKFKDRLKSEAKSFILSCVTIGILAIVAWETTVYRSKVNKANKEKY